MQDEPRVGFIGAGRMATALAGGLSAAGFTTTEAIMASDIVESAREAFARATGSRAVEDNAEVLAGSDIVVLAVKPQQVDEVLDGIAAGVTTGHLVVSIAAGITLSRLAVALGDDRRLIRVMPNTPCLVGLSASAFAVGGAATDADAELVERLLSTVGLAIRVDESQLDAVTGLSGSGPAYIYRVIDAMAEGGVRAGLDNPRHSPKPSPAPAGPRSKDSANSNAEDCGKPW